MRIEYPIFYTCDVGYPSTGKSATEGALLKPLKKMQAAEQERLDEVLAELVQLEEAWKELSKEQRAEKAESDENPRIFNEKYCKAKKWVFNPQRASAQAITKRIAEQQPMHGCLLLQDELSGLFESLDQFTGGKGGQRQFLLEAWNGRLEGSVDRVDLKSDSYTFKEQTLSVTGTMQPDVARKIFNVASDPDGMLSRFLPAVAGIPPNFAQRPTVRVSLNRMLTELVKNLERLPETLLTLPARTADVFWDYWEKLRRGQEINFGNNPAYSYFLGKQISYVGRFAIVLHCLENLGGVEIPTRVTPETMSKAIRLSLFYCNQFLLLQSKSAQQQPIEGILLDILKFAQEKGGQVSTRDLCRSRFQRIEVEGKKLTSSTAGKLLKGIADAGFGFFEEAGNQRTLTLNKGLSSLSSDCHQTVINLNPTQGKALAGDCHQMTEVYISKNSDRTGNFTEAFIEESDTATSIENIEFCHLMTVSDESLLQQGLEVDDSLMTVGDSDDSFSLNENENELLEYLQKAVAEEDAYFAQQVRGILKEVCDTGAADRKKVWGALSDQEQKILLAAERKGGAITIRDAQLAFNSKFRPTAQVARLWFGELVALGYGVTKKSGKSLIFENTRRSDDQFLQSPSNPDPVKNTATDLALISADQFLQSKIPTVGTDHQMIHEVIQAPPLQRAGSGSIVGTDPDFATSKNFPTDESVKKEFVRVAKYKTAPKLNFEFGRRFTNKFLLVLILTLWVVQAITRQSQLFQLRSVFRQRLQKFLISHAKEPPLFVW